MICAWFAWFFLLISFILVVMAGLHYRRAENQRRAGANGAPVNEKHSSELHPEHAPVTA